MHLHRVGALLDARTDAREALGLLGGIGMVLMVFAFKLPPGKPPVDVMLTIIAVVAASATLQACAMQPRGTNGDSASKTSLIEPRQASPR